METLKNILILTTSALLLVLWIAVGALYISLPIILAIIYSDVFILLAYLAYPFISWVAVPVWVVGFGFIGVLLELIN